ncbi:unnamed protein product [Vitrella brassicaformis CCMP3155]|uniref:RING-type domain-containing protein n=1 Tax=Vitrella brassicaformis (strain CCMP3155) TaxID=1169540 RepID=A0A0G4G401_VITBC|nr:unnamed protein product [Vitrella brassicaformis CCMP3155]|eukprot:CEM22815.1 unnamed protein product [Vitrella brassicaformis CCMP3155]
MAYNLRNTEARQARDYYAGNVRRLFQEGNGQEADEPSQQTQSGALCTVCAEELHGDALHRLPCHPDTCIRCLLRTYTHQNGHRCPQCRAHFAFEVLEEAVGDEGTLPLCAHIIEHVHRNAPRADASDQYNAGDAVEGRWRLEEDVLMLPGTNTLLLELPQLNRNLELGIEEPPLPGSMAEMEDAIANDPELYGPARQEEQDDEWRPPTEPS